MASNQITEDDVLVIGDCLSAAADGPFFPDWEFQTLFGLEREEVRKVASLWPFVDHNDNDVNIAVNNSLLHLAGYPHRVREDWSNWVRIPRDQLPAVIARWRGKPPNSYLDALM